MKPSSCLTFLFRCKQNFTIIFTQARERKQEKPGQLGERMWASIKYGHYLKAGKLFFPGGGGRGLLEVWRLNNKLLGV
jgi:hypothetical protein